MAKEKKEKKPVTKGAAIRLTTILTIVAVICLGVMIALPIVLNYYDGVMRDFFGEASSSGESSSDYNEQDYDSYEILMEKEKEYVRKGGAESVVLLKNDGILPLKTSSANKTKVAFFSQSSVDIIVGGSGSGESSSDVTLKEAFESEDYEVNEALWNYYKSSGSSRGPGASYSGSGNWYFGESSIDTLQSKVDLNVVKSSGAVPIFIMSRTGGEGADEPRYMGESAKTGVTADASKSYLEPDSYELGVIDYLNKNFSDVILVLNTNNMMETGWIDDYENISAVLWAPGAGDQTAYALADVIKGNVSPSGRLVDTMAYSDFSSPAMQNMGDFRYTNGGDDTSYYGVSYDEGIYVGYKYYETRYYDAVMGQGNATGSAGVYCSSGNSWNYSEEVAYPFGYGGSYTEFTWSGFKATENEDDTFTVSVNVENTGDVPGKDVVEVYLNAPYTDYDKTNHVEKSAVTLVGFEKTKTLEPGDDETVEIVVDRSDFASYDDVGYKTYVLEAGDYLLTAATDAHEATNNFLAYEGKSAGTGGLMTADGDEDFVYTYTQDDDDATTYAVSATGADVTNRFESAAASTATTVTSNCNYIDRDKYLTRNDWQGSWPVTHGNQSDKTASSFDEVNGYQYKEEISSTLLAKLQEKGTAEAANSPVDDSSITSEMAGEYGVEGDLELIDYRGLDYDDADWMVLVSQMTSSEYAKIINLSGYKTESAESIQKPRAVDKDGPAGITNMVGGGENSIAFLTDEAVATTWNEDVSYYHGYFIGQDGLTFDEKVNGWYGPAMNIHRTPFAGRNFEYYSEDGYLSGVMARNAVRGAADNGMYSFIKHFALNDQETHRSQEGVSTWCNEQAMREIYLKPFQMVSESGTVTEKYYAQVPVLDKDGLPVLDSDGEAETTLEMSECEIPLMQAVMTSFNRVGATWAGGSYQLVQEILRDEWGFDGFVITDYTQGQTGYMHTCQMLRAGGDAQLSQWGDKFSAAGDADVYYSKVAMSHILYTVVNSNAMNSGYSAIPFAYYYLVEIALEIVFAAGIVLCVVFTVRKWNHYKKGGDNKPDDSYESYGTSDELSL